MSNQDLLLEIGLEEMPARFMHDSMTQLGEKLESWLKEKILPSVPSSCITPLEDWPFLSRTWRRSRMM